MTSARTLLWIERLAWICIYVGLFVLILGLAARPVSPAAGWSLIVTGGAAVVAGVVLILVRSRLRETPGAQSATPSTVRQP